MTKPDAARHGRLIYVAGPSGAGKDSVIAGAKKIVNKNNYLHFAPRYVTRPAGHGGDLPISEVAFAHYHLNGFFALEWSAHGYRYGIGAAINAPLSAGQTVVVNGSRANIPAALAQYPAMTVVHISVPPDVAHARLIARSREDAAAIAERVSRAPPLAIPAAQLITIDNSGALETAVQALACVLLEGNHAARIPRGATA